MYTVGNPCQFRTDTRPVAAATAPPRRPSSDGATGASGAVAPTVTFAGRVVHPDGRPVTRGELHVYGPAGAHVHVAVDRGAFAARRVVPGPANVVWEWRDPRGRVTADFGEVDLPAEGVVLVVDDVE